MGDTDFVDLGEDFTFVDTPDLEFVDSPNTAPLVRLAYAKMLDLSSIYLCRIIRGGKVQRRGIFTARVGHGGSIIMQLRAERQDTGEEIPLPLSQMQKIQRIKLCLASGKSIDSNDADVGLGDGKAFNHTLDQANAKLAINIGGIASLSTMVGNYPDAHLDVYFSDQTLPEPFEFFASEVLAGD